jgi:hypothetical protein
MATGPVEPFGAIDARDLDLATLHHGLARHGCVWVRGLVPLARAAAFARGIDRALAAFDECLATGAGGAPPWYEPFPTADAGQLGWRRRGWLRSSGAMLTADSPRMVGELTSLVEDTGVLALVEGHFGERPALSVEKCTLRRVPADSSTSWHQDGAFLGRDVPALNLWLALSSCGVDAPGLDLVPRRFCDLLPTGTEGAAFDWSVAAEVVEDAAGGAGAIVRPAFGPGDALLFDQLFVHRTGAAPGMGRERWATEAWFFAPSTYPEALTPFAI